MDEPYILDNYKSHKKLNSETMKLNNIWTSKIKKIKLRTSRRICLLVNSISDKIILSPAKVFPIFFFSCRIVKSLIPADNRATRLIRLEPKSQIQQKQRGRE